ncbi:hypothetical protein CJ739_149 [Mariniflexile rhizosphaerae]|uniref:lipoprotein N-acyltransferase Lnb domain-containing protein n=1 Tax=unclassified Mariniflexile TaxID=2643887 RepID=UPI000CCB69BD|nr:DUF4105 domain-containing protein [Mariniflexile sp. TRM1-10]AXP79249.1 hypothetical protein CJ739_149 [Mariniflexile sp. TRM1-10]PLB17703.1 MAG: hypothetical protein TRG1_3426 [Flavobacteriaceae bacterium FS1-H7996/R]
MQKKLLFLCLFLFVEVITAQQDILSEQAEISVLTIGPGALLNDSFGHNAFRVKDPVKGIDLAFNYGVYDFETPNFYLKFAQGKLNYLIGLNYYEDFFEAYISQNRSIKEQVLNLSQIEKQKLFDYLLNNIKPENRRYLYDFFYDNCATKIKDVTNIALNNSIQFNDPRDFKPQTFRELIHSNLNRNSWGCFGIDLALGSVIDKKATPEEHMFLPKYIYRFFEVATIKNSNKPLIKKSNVLYEKIDAPVPSQFLTSPLFIFGILGGFILFITYTDFKKQKQSVWLDITLFSLTGIIGILILLLWFATDHKGTHQNYNLLWACALNILVIGQLLKQKTSTWFIKYLKFLVILLCLLTLHWIIGVQVFAIGLIPFLIALFIRYLFLIKYYSNRH